MSLDGTQGSNEPVMSPEQIEAANAAANAQDDADFLAAFNNATGDEPGTEVSTTNTSTTSAPAAAATPTPGTQGSTDDDDDEDELETDPATGAPLVQPGAAAEDDLDAPVTLTRRQLAEMTSMSQTVAALQAELRKTVDSTNGRLGSIQQTLKEVREQAGKGIRPNLDQLEAMEEAFPELAAVLKQDLGRIFGKGNEVEPGTGDDPTASGEQAPGAAVVDPLQVPEVRAALRDAQLAIVDAKHEGWRELPKTTEWQTWANQLPPTAKELLRTTSEAAVLTDAINDFKDWQKKQAAAVSANTERGRRLENAIPATTGSARAHRAAPNEDDEFEAGFQQVKGR